MAIDTASSAGWVLAVRLRSCSGPSRQRRASGSPRAASASSKVARAAGETAAQALPIPTFCDPWPGKTKATRRIGGVLPPPALELVLVAVELGQLLADLPVELGVGELHGPPDGAMDSARVRAAMADETAAADAEQRRGAVLAVVDPLPETVERRPGEDVAELGAGAAG